MSLYISVGLGVVALLLWVYNRWLDHLERVRYDEIGRRERLRALLRHEREIRK